MSPKARSFYAGTFIISAALMAMQVVETRIFSVTTWYHLSFLIISIAMFGLTLGALRVHRGNATEQRREHGPLMARACRDFAVYTLLSLMGQMCLPVISFNVWLTLLTLPVMAAFVIPPYYFAGTALSLAITRAPYPTARTYGVDLLGASAGCLLALGIMELIDAPSAVLLLSLAGVAAAGCFHPGTARPARGFALVSGALLALNVALPKPFIYPLWSKDSIVMEDVLDFDRWNSISRVAIEKRRRDEPPPLWGPSRRLPPGFRASFMWLSVDGNAGTVMTRFGGDCANELKYLDYDLTTLAYALPGLKKAAVIGAGGGRDILSACHAGVPDITAMDVNSTQISLLTRTEPFRSYANLANLPGLRLVHSEARSWLSHNPDTFDIIQMSLIDTWAATGAGAFALSENGLYTVEAWRTFLGRLKPGGVMTVSRWYGLGANESQRLISLATATLLAGGAKDPARHIFFASDGRSGGDAPNAGLLSTLVLSRDPLTARQLDALEARVKKMDFHVILTPRRAPAPGDAFGEILRAKDADALRRLSDAKAFDISPPTDQRPFFFNQVRLTQPSLVFALVTETLPEAARVQAGTLGGHARATVNLYIIILFSLLTSAAAIVYPLRGELKKGSPREIAGGTLWFLLIGLGFMLLEISLLQRMSVYLGHPAYGLGIVLFSIVLSTGLGSLLCDRFPLSSHVRRVCWIAAAAGMAFAEVGLLDGVIAHFPDVTLFCRAALCVGMILPLGLLLGFGFPTGLGMAKGRGTAWLWGINGAAGVTGSALAIASNIAFGLGHTMMIGAACYALLLVPAMMARGRT